MNHIKPVLFGCVCCFKSFHILIYQRSSWIDWIYGLLCNSLSLRFFSNIWFFLLIEDQDKIDYFWEKTIDWKIRLLYITLSAVRHIVYFDNILIQIQFFNTCQNGAFINGCWNLALWVKIAVNHAFIAGLGQQLIYRSVYFFLDIQSFFLHIKQLREKSVDIIWEFWQLLGGLFGDSGCLFFVEHLEIVYCFWKYNYRH